MENLNLKPVQEDKIEVFKQTTEEIQTIFDRTVYPQKNHTLFEIDLISGEVKKAEFDAPPAIKFTDAMVGVISAKKKVTKKPNCIYVFALNKKNVIKILKRDFGLVKK